MEAIVLAGALGSRLGEITKAIPKPMVDVGGRPFLAYVLRYLRTQGVNKAILAVSHKWQVMHEHIGGSYAGLEISYSVEREPLGTGGGLRQALELTETDDIVVVNGDTYFEVPIRNVLRQHQTKRRQVTLSLKPMRNCSRYGSVTSWMTGVTG